jgi:hypothetical protein
VTVFQSISSFWSFGENIIEKAADAVTLKTSGFACQIDFLADKAQYPEVFAMGSLK